MDQRNRFRPAGWILVGVIFGGGCGDDAMPAMDPETADSGADSGGATDASTNDADLDGGDRGFVTGTRSADTVLIDSSRENREVGLRVHYPLGTRGSHFVVLISHGGLGWAAGETRFDHLGLPIAQRGGIAVQLGHRPSTDTETHRLDRPLDVSFVIDAFAADEIELPEFGGTLDTERVGHVGHSAGAYTSHAVANGQYLYDPKADARIAAIAPISPQGEGDFFEAYDNGPQDNTWNTVRVPLLTMIGGAEINSAGDGMFIAVGWRLEPWDHYPEGFDRMRIIIPEQTHAQMGGLGAPSVQRYIGNTVATFFAAYLADDQQAACELGTEPRPDDIQPRIEQVASVNGLLQGCS